MSKNLIIDGQILQTEAWHRGMGKYLMRVLEELNKHVSKDFEVKLVFNLRLNNDKEHLELIRKLCPNIKQIHTRLPIDSDRGVTPKQYIAALESALTNEHYAEQNYYMATSLFFFDFFSDFPSGFYKLLVFYDLTPLLFWQELGGYFLPELYMSRFKTILEADKIFAISSTTRKDLLKSLGIPPDNVVNINGGFSRLADKSTKPGNFDVPDKYILFPTGDLPHKNNRVAVQGFSECVRSLDDDVSLIITSNFQTWSKEELKGLSDKVVFSGNVTDSELEWLYENAEVILFASKYEGLGMPILDAVADNKPVVTSQISVFEEMSKEAFYYFDPNEPTELAVALKKALKKVGFKEKSQHYQAILGKYQWSNTGNAIMETLGRQDEPSEAPNRHRKPLIAVVGIHPGISNQIGRLAEPLFYSLNKKFRVDYYFDVNGHYYGELERPTFLDQFDRQPQDISKLNKHSYKKYDKVIYLLDKDSLPSYMAQRALMLPAIAITDFPDKPLDDYQQEMFKQLVLESQRKLLDRPRSYAQYKKLAESL